MSNEKPVELTEAEKGALWTWWSADFPAPSVLCETVATIVAAREAAARREALLDAAAAVQRRMDGAELADGGKLQTWDALAGVMEWIEGKTDDLEGALGDRLNRIKDMGSTIAALEAQVARAIEWARVEAGELGAEDLRAALAEPERDEEGGR